MAGKTVPVSAVSSETWARLDAILDAVGTIIPSTARRALDKSTICRLAIEEMLDRYEPAPAKLAKKLGFSVSSQMGH